MAIHHINCRTASSGIDNLATIVDAMTWLCGDEELLLIDRTTSFHGSEINLITSHISKNRDIKSFVDKLKQADLLKISENLSDRIDDSNILHFRICLDSLISGEISLTEADKKTVKCSIKIEVYPGQNAVEEITNFLG
ncbi:MAG: RNA-binding domain-containing protein, partial [Candidatus Thermoplasmatota archaeon]|nr:RNA-binding domain-containing protein [Candidatus Thermoplasmatota archaeon]